MWPPSTTTCATRGLLNDTLILQFSEFGRRISENGSQGTDHGAGAIMMAMGGAVRGGIYGTAPSLDPNPANPTLENNGGDVRFETDFRSVYAQGAGRLAGRELDGDPRRRLPGRGARDHLERSTVYSLRSTGPSVGSVAVRLSGRR